MLELIQIDVAAPRVLGFGSCLNLYYYLLVLFLLSSSSFLSNNASVASPFLYSDGLIINWYERRRRRNIKISFILPCRYSSSALDMTRYYSSITIGIVTKLILSHPPLLRQRLLNALLPALLVSLILFSQVFTALASLSSSQTYKELRYQTEIKVK